MKVNLYLKDKPDAPPIEREAVDAREILLNPESLYTTTPGDPEAAPHKILIEGMSPSGLTFVNAAGLTADQLAGISFEEIGVRLDLKAMNERDVNALRAWHQGLAERRKRIAQEMAPQPGQERPAPASERHGKTEPTRKS